MKNKKTLLIICAALFLAGFFICIKTIFANAPSVVINEVAWMGSVVSPSDEFIELLNLTNENIDLSGWKLIAKDGTPEIIFSGEIIALGYFLLERTNDDSVPGKKADRIYTGALKNGGEILELRNEKGNLVDQVDAQTGWLAGNNKTKQTMERDEKGNWKNSQSPGGTPGEKNSKEADPDPDPDPRPEVYSDKIMINEIFPAPDKSNIIGEFVEFYNSGDEEIDLNGWRLKDENLEGKSDKSCKLPNIIVEPGKYEVFYLKKCSPSLALNNDADELNLYNPIASKPTSTVSYEGNKLKNHSYSFDGKNWQWTSFITPGEENKFPEKKTYSDIVYLNEILPNPSGDEKTGEFIEIYNPNENKIDLSGWILKDASKTGKYIFPESTGVKEKSFLVIYRIDFKFALNNSGGESVYLLDPNGKTVSSLAYSKAKEAVSYNFNGAEWRWSKYLTPGKNNRFNNLPAIKIIVDKKAYKNIYVNFEVSVNDPDKDEVRVTWDFGDNRKSYKKKTRHKYKETGEFNASVKIFDGSEEVFEKFKIKVRKFPNPKVRIVSLMPNPAGKDSESEWIKVKNKSKKKVNLKNWSIATGRNSKKMINHPIYEDLIIKSGKEAIITREISKFSLNNKKSRIELRYPNGKMAHRTKYKRKDGVEEDEIYEKVKGDGWKWTKGVKTQEQESIKTKKDDNTATSINEEINEIPEIIIGGQSETEASTKNKIILAVHHENKKLAENIMNNQGRVLGASNIKKDNLTYIFTGNINYPKKSHYAVVFAKKLLWKINSFISGFLRQQQPYDTIFLELGSRKLINQ